MRVKFPKANKQLIQCSWLDAAGYIGSNQEEAKPAADAPKVEAKKE